MAKLVWVLLPLIHFAWLLGWKLLRRRAPSPHALTIGFSLLLLACLATTAGLCACPVGAFHEHEAAALVAADPAREWVLYFVALGRQVG